MNKKALSLAGLLVALTLLFAVNILSSSVFTAARVDLTENHLFTLSDGTRNILAGLQEPITLRLYLSERLIRNLPAINSYATRIKSLLDEYARAADGMIEVHIIDPEPFSEEEDRAVGFGLTGVPMEGGEEKLYMGLVGTNSVDDEDIGNCREQERIRIRIQDNQRAQQLSQNMVRQDQEKRAAEARAVKAERRNDELGCSP